MSRLSYKERLVADGISWASQVAAAVPLLGKLTVGDAGGRGVIIPYHRSNTVVTDVKSWDRFACDPNASRVPRFQKSIGVITIQTELVRAEQERLARYGIDSKVAVAWAAGRAVMVGDLPGWDNPDEVPNPTFGLRVGPEDLNAALALHLTGDRVYVPGTGFTVIQQQMHLDDVPLTVPIY